MMVVNWEMSSSLIFPHVHNLRLVCHYRDVASDGIYPRIDETLVVLVHDFCSDNLFVLDEGGVGEHHCVKLHGHENHNQHQEYPIRS